MPLRRTQRWLQDAITALQPPTATPIAPSPTLAPSERLEIYRDLYPARLVGALTTDYPLLHRYLGSRRFTELALRYARAHPSRSFTLNAFGATFPEFVAKAPSLRRPEFAHDLALFERATTQVFHAPQAEPLTPGQIAAVPADAWEHARLDAVPALRLLALRYPVHRYAEGASRIARRNTWLAVYRRNYEVAWLPLTEAGHTVLSRLCTGRPLGKALAGIRGPAQHWFQQWTAAGLFQGVNVR
jgi:hypothetical protein